MVFILPLLLIMNTLQLHTQANYTLCPIYLNFSFISFLKNQVTALWFVQWNTIVKLIPCKWDLLGACIALMTILAISFTLSLPLLLILVFHIQRFITYHHAVIHISPCELIKEQFFSWGEASLLCCFISCTRMKRAWGKKTMLSALTHLPARHWGMGRGQRIFYLTLSLAVETSGRPRLLWHTWWSASLHMIMTALLDLLKSTCYSETKWSW